MLISALTRKPLRRRRMRRARKAQGTRSLIPGKSGCDTGWGCKAARTSHLGFFDFLGSPVTPSLSSTSPSSACTQPSSLSQRFSVQSHGPGIKALSNIYLNTLLSVHLILVFDRTIKSVDLPARPLWSASSLCWYSSSASCPALPGASVASSLIPDNYKHCQKIWKPSCVRSTKTVPTLPVTSLFVFTSRDRFWEVWS